MNNQENFVPKRAGDDPFATLEEILEIERKKREVCMRLFLKGNPDFKAKVISDFEFNVREKIAHIVGSKSNITYIIELLNPVHSAVGKLEEHGPLKGVLPALLYAILTPLFHGLPRAVVHAPQDYLTIQKNYQKLTVMVDENDMNRYDWSHLSAEYKSILDEIVGLKDLVKENELYGTYAHQ